MRSRYMAYASGVASYIIQTTHPDGPQFQTHSDRWMAEINAFCQAHQFLGLTIHDHSMEDTVGTVHFTATLERDGTSAHLEENSIFYRVHDRWLYWGPTPTSSD